MRKTAIVLMAAAVSVLAIPSAYAYDDIRSDWRHIQRDRAGCTPTKRDCAMSEASCAPRNDARTGRCATAGSSRHGAPSDWSSERHETFTHLSGRSTAIALILPATELTCVATYACGD